MVLKLQITIEKDLFVNRFFKKPKKMQKKNMCQNQKPKNQKLKPTLEQQILKEATLSHQENI